MDLLKIRDNKWILVNITDSPLTIKKMTKWQSRAHWKICFDVSISWLIVSELHGLCVYQIYSITKLYYSLAWKIIFKSSLCNTGK